MNTNATIGFVDLYQSRVPEMQRYQGYTTSNCSDYSKSIDIKSLDAVPIVIKAYDITV